MTKVVKKHNAIQTAYANWLNSQGWTHFVTLTTPYTLTLNSARRLIDRFHTKLKEQNFEPITFYVCERFEVKDGYHLHALMKLNKSKLEKHEYTFITELYQMCAGTSKVTKIDGNLKYINWSRIDLQKYSKTKNGGGYVTKYIMKENKNKGAEYDLLI